MRTIGLSRSSGVHAHAVSTTIYGRLPPQGGSSGIGGAGCANLSGLLLQPSCSWP
jgi:hypothetical protein